jgi:hypothetical protein
MPDEPITDLVYIEQTSKANERENLEFRTYVRGDLDLSDYRLHGIVQQTTQEVWAHIDCRTCANCCKTRHPVFSRAEVQRIADLHRNFRNRLWQTIDNAETCPIVFNVLERLKRRLGFRDKDMRR